MKIKQNILNNNYVIIYAALVKNRIVFFVFEIVVCTCDANSSGYGMVLTKKITSFVDLNLSML